VRGEFYRGAVIMSKGPWEALALGDGAAMMARMGKRGESSGGGLGRWAAVLARAVALAYGFLGLATLVAGIGLIAGWWNVYHLGGELVERSAPPGLFVRLVLPSLLAAQDLADESGILLVAIGGFHLAAGGLFLARPGWGRPPMLVLSGFYIVTFALYCANAHFSHRQPVGVFLALLAAHVVFFAVLLGRTSGGRRKA